MTENEAIEMLDNIQVDTRDLKHALKCCDLIETAIKALEEVQDYRKIGTVEEVREAVEKTKAKKPIVHKNTFSNAYTCPTCNLLFIHRDETGWFCGKHYIFCPDCGKKIDWSKE